MCENFQFTLTVDIIMKMVIMIKAMIMMNSVETLLSLQELEIHKYIFQDGGHLQ